MITQIWCNGEFLGRFTDEALELWFLFYHDESKDYQMFYVEEPV